MIPLQLAAGIFTLLAVFIGIIQYRLEKYRNRTERLETLLADARRELGSMEKLKSRVLRRIGDVLSEPLNAIESASDNLQRENPSLPDQVLEDLKRLSEKVHTLVRILTVFEQISQENTEEKGIQKTEKVCLDDIVAEVAMDITDNASEKMVSLSVSIAGTAEVQGVASQLTEAVTSLLEESLKRAARGTVLFIELKLEQNTELEIRWTGNGEAESRIEETRLGTGLTRLIASSHGGWLSEDLEKEEIRLILPRSGEN